MRHFDPVPIGYFKIDWTAFGLEVKKLRKENGLSVRALSEVVNISLSTISRCENGYTIEPDHFFTLLQFIGVQPCIPERFLKRK